MENATIRFELDKRSLGKRDNRYPMKLVVSFHGQWKRYKTQFRFNDEEWELLWSPKLQHKNLKNIKIDIAKISSQGHAVVEQLGFNFSFEKFERLFLGKKTDKELQEEKRQQEEEELKKKQDNVYYIFKEYIQNLYDSDRIGTAEAYEVAMKSFMRYRPKLTFADVTPQFLYRYEDYMLKNKKSITTVSIYTRALRTMYNVAMDEGVVSRESYPFGLKIRKKYEVPVGRNIKKALDVEDIRKIKNADHLTEEYEFARDMWMFSFYCNGINMSDIFFMKYENIDGRMIRLFRNKTKRTQRDKLPVEIYLIDEAVKILAKWKAPEIYPSDYVFGLITDRISLKEKYNLKKNFTRSINQYMETLSMRLGIQRKLTTNVARHSYATMLKELNVPIEEISECLGHSNTKTTLNYLNSFSYSRKKATAEMLQKIL